jgi:hypothetical protein
MIAASSGEYCIVSIPIHALPPPSIACAVSQKRWISSCLVCCRYLWQWEFLLKPLLQVILATIRCGKTFNYNVELRPNFFGRIWTCKLLFEARPPIFDDLITDSSLNSFYYPMWKIFREHVYVRTSTNTQVLWSRICLQPTMVVGWVLSAVVDSAIAFTLCLYLRKRRTGMNRWDINQTNSASNSPRCP